ncbi:hypothetical protein PROFUN_09182 [Planoprotostelium fungivorum]|uniref:Uncharacterized protein n=1 Tax=Planoprotostelium fungivorum TaxID=1890364 RepID=A0A2P6NHI5_9EUKA|nr:hypothetical protein PROFUN_09182 [Planoprotostelium fungivorum]
MSKLFEEFEITPTNCIQCLEESLGGGNLTESIKALSFLTWFQ